MLEDVKSKWVGESFPRWASVAGVGLCLLLVLGLLFSSDSGSLSSGFQLFSFFKIQQVKVSSEWPLANSELRAWIPKLEGKNLMMLSAKELVANLEKHPWIEHVVVKKQYPDQLWIEVGTKRPRALSVIKGVAYFIDSRGNVIDKARPNLLKTLDLPFVSFSSEKEKWNIEDILSITDQFKILAHSKYSISQVILGNYPYFKIFLDNPKLEVLLNRENWQSQSKLLETLLLDPPSQMQKLQRINLMFPKKAVVSVHN